MSDIYTVDIVVSAKTDRILCFVWGGMKILFGSVLMLFGLWSFASVVFKA
jgi:hypothetical protein